MDSFSQAKIIGYSGRVITAFQMGGGMERAIGSRKIGAEGNPPLALRRSIDLALTQNQAGQHVNYVEIYGAEVLPANMQPVLRDEAARFPTFGARLLLPAPPAVNARFKSARSRQGNTGC